MPLAKTMKIGARERQSVIEDTSKEAITKCAQEQLICDILIDIEQSEEFGMISMDINDQIIIHNDQIINKKKICDP